MNANLTATATLKAQIAPVLSQVVLVCSTAAGMLALGLGYMARDYPISWALIIGGFASLAYTVHSWGKSHGNVDLQNAQPTEIDLPDGGTFRADARLFQSIEHIRELGGLIDSVFTRQALPAPDALVDAEMKLVPGSQAAAELRARKVNEDALAQKHALAQALGASYAPPGVSAVGTSDERGLAGIAAPVPDLHSSERAKDEE